MTRLLILVPTAFELGHVQPALEDTVRAADGEFAVCGFGLIASGVITAQLITKHQPQKVILVGIAGALNPQAAIGIADIYSRIGCYGIGAGSGSDFQTASELGWAQGTDPDSGQSFGDTIRLTADGATGADEPMLLSVCSASASPQDVADRLEKFPQAIAEDMEAFSVAMACQMAGVPLTVIRGISNIAGDRNKAHWDVARALEAAAELTISRLTT